MKQTKAERKASKAQGDYLISVYDKVVGIEASTKNIKTKELETLSSEIYNVIVSALNPKRKVLLNELLDIEVELRVRQMAD